MGRMLVDRGEELEGWLKRDPVEILRTKIAEMVGNETHLEEIEDQVEKEIEDALEFAKQSDYPDVADAFDDVYSERVSDFYGLS